MVKKGKGVTPRGVGFNSGILTSFEPALITLRLQEQRNRDFFFSFLILSVKDYFTDEIMMELKVSKNIISNLKYFFYDQC